MDTTPLLHKAVVYGSDLANLLFILLVAFHALCGGVALVSGVVALVAKKGRRLHLRAGPTFVYAMAVTAVTGIVLDVIRLSFHVAENHTHYVGTSMPSSYPARLGFLYAAFGVLYMVSFVRPTRRQATPPKRTGMLVPGALLAIGAAITIAIAVRFNPWTGALWMVWTFMAGIAITARYRRDEGSAPSVGQHRFTMLFLAAFSFWGALQGFGPAIGIALYGVDQSGTPYVGDQPGPFTPFFFAFLVGWSPAFLLAAYLLRRHAKKASRETASASSA